MGGGIRLRTGRFEAEREESADSAFTCALEAHREILLTVSDSGGSG